VYHNNLINNTQNAYDECSDTWDNGYPSGGNFWSDYTGVDEYSGPEQDIPGSDGIGDTPYIIQGYYGPNEIDRYPLMNPSDRTPPVTTHEFDGISGDNGWFVSNVTVILSAVDYSAGVDFTMYKLDAGIWTTYTAPFSVTDDSNHTLSYYSVDKVGNKETEKGPFDFKLDKTIPLINLTVEKTGLSKWLLTATVSDETSGIAKVEFYLNGECLGEATESPYEWTVFKQGTAQAIVYDNAGNSKVSDAIPVSVNLDLNSQSATNNQVVSGSQSQSSPVGGQSQSICSTLQRLFNLR
jgi:hypothetical protein